MTGYEAGHAALVKLWVLVDLAVAGADIHAHDFVHGDMKLDNGLLRDVRGGWIALFTDGNLAHKLPASQGVRMGAHGGTPHFMAPEQLTGEHVSRRCDRFAFGALMY